jgi:hypothetical protein
VRETIRGNDSGSVDINVNVRLHVTAIIDALVL